jgi:hypothetical protein
MSEPTETGPVARQLVHASQDVEMAAHFARAQGGEHSAAFASLAITVVRAWAAELERSRAERVHISQVYTGLDNQIEAYHSACRSRTRSRASVSLIWKEAAGSARTPTSSLTYSWGHGSPHRAGARPRVRRRELPSPGCR